MPHSQAHSQSHSPLACRQLEFVSDSVMKWFLVAVRCCLLIAAISTSSCLLAASPLTKPHSNTIVIDAAPSVVSHQGSSQSTARLVIAPIGRSLGYVESAPAAAAAANMTRHPRNDFDELLEVLTIRPVYVHQTG